ncbi:DUF2911 domain-containing protein [Algoriphagus machipongonensis]|uniref:DUF2911 domain-containing protein n=1 Tax=Algoriphagus machipongonensis TaxID=388413 RepID=A3I1W5_9BACT|nr:DUF2911 domain-containing protein [Algoriphagus machipongonensis]EAZ79781.1 hypothetical protein ALPR1_09153 [Algoriphagus machipongonensis]
MKTQNIVWYSVFIATFFFSCDPKSSESLESSSSEELAMETGEVDNRPSPLEVKDGQIGGKSFKIHYSSPAVKDRAIWGDLVPYNVVWRTGANEATYVELAEDFSVEGEILPAGKYSLFTIPKESTDWTVIFNSEWDLEHGHFQYDEENDVLRVDVSPVWEENSQERLAIDIESPGIVIRWEKLKLPISIN